MANGDKFPIKAKASPWWRWEDEFNAKLAGEALADGVQVELVRPVRSMGSLNTHIGVGTIFRLPLAFQPATPNNGCTHPRERRS